MTVDRLVRYAAPIHWFSPDEPSLDGAEGAAIRHPEPFTFEGASDHPVVYYQLTDLFVRGADDEASAFERNDADIGASRIDLRSTVGLELSYYAYTTTEAGLGRTRTTSSR